MWNTELESLVKGFNEYAKKVGDWDMKLLANSNKIYELHSEVQKVVEQLTCASGQMRTSVDVESGR